MRASQQYQQAVSFPLAIDAISAVVTGRSDALSAGDLSAGDLSYGDLSYGNAVRLQLEPSLRPSDYAFAHQLRVRFAETDAMAIVHHSRYLPYLEEARVEYLRSIGHPYVELRAEGVDYAVLEAFVQYRRPLRFDDVVEVHLRAGAATRATFQMAYLLTVGNEVRATAVTVHGCVNAAGRAVRMPKWLLELGGT